MIHEIDKEELAKQEKAKDVEMPDGTGRKSIGIENADDLPMPKVKRIDGLPTIDDLKKLMGKGEEEEPTMGEKVGNMVEIILKIR